MAIGCIIAGALILDGYLLAGGDGLDRNDNGGEGMRNRIDLIRRDGDKRRRGKKEAKERTWAFGLQL